MNQENSKKIDEEFEKIKRFIPLSVADILDMKPPKEPFLVKKLIPHKSICVLSGYPESCKSWILLHLAQCVASGKPLFGEFKTKKVAVLIIDEETGVEEFRRRIKLMRFRRKLPIYIFSQREIKVDSPNDLNIIINLIREKNIKLVIIDPFIAIHSKIENSAEEMQKVVEAFQKLVFTEATVLFAHHHRKESGEANISLSQTLRGSSALSGRVDSHLDVKKLEENQSETILAITQVKSRRGKKISPFKLKMIEQDGKIIFELVGEYDEKKIKSEEIKSKIISILEELKSADFDELFEKLKGTIGKVRLRETLNKLKGKGEIDSKKIEHGKEIFWKKDNL